MLEAKNLTKQYGGSTALDGLNLNIARGEIFCLLGANGAGKTTAINLFLNFIPPTSGTATINGMDVVEHPLETKRFIAYIPEQVMLYRNLTGLENLEYFTAFAGMGKYTRPQLMNFLNDAGLPHGAAGKRISTYSKGMRQKAGIAIATAKKAKALILAFTYNLISAEKEHGTLALTLSQPVLLSRIVAGKILILGVVITALFILLTVIGAWLSGTTLLSAE